MPSTYNVLGYREYVCRAGESWDLLAGQAYGHEVMASVIIQANPEMADVVMFDGGEVIQLPLVDVVESPSTLPPWRRAS